jgi:hypothetical protein
MLGVPSGLTPLFGFRPQIPLRNGRTDRTEIDLKLGELMVEAKLTETDFQTAPASPRAISAVTTLASSWIGITMPTAGRAKRAQGRPGTGAPPRGKSGKQTTHTGIRND